MEEAAMNEMQTRRGALIAAAAVGAGASFAASASTPPETPGGAPGFGRIASDDPALDARRRDWEWLVGRWAVRHHRLKSRLTGSTEWEDFDGTCVMSPTLGGLGNVDDNVLEIPSGTYRAVGIRAYDPATNRWAIWWLDARRPTTIEPPVYGGFVNGVFTGDDTLRGQPIKVRFRWSEITSSSARWEQAFSADGGRNWEVNWVMRFTRVAT